MTSIKNKIQIATILIVLLLSPKIYAMLHQSVDYQIESPFLGAVSQVCNDKFDNKFKALKEYNVNYFKHVNKMTSGFTKGSIIQVYRQHYFDLKPGIDEITCAKFNFFLDRNHN